MHKHSDLAAQMYMHHRKVYKYGHAYRNGIDLVKWIYTHCIHAFTPTDLHFQFNRKEKTNF
jgi:hypothetical protein